MDHFTHEGSCPQDNCNKHQHSQYVLSDYRWSKWSTKLLTSIYNVRVGSQYTSAHSCDLCLVLAQGPWTQVYVEYCIYEICICNIHMTVLSMLGLWEKAKGVGTNCTH